MRTSTRASDKGPREIGCEFHINRSCYRTASRRSELSEVARALLRAASTLMSTAFSASTVSRRVSTRHARVRAPPRIGRIYPVRYSISMSLDEELSEHAEHAKAPFEKKVA